MKKRMILVAALALLCNLVIAGYAAQNGLSIEDVPATSEEVVYLTLCLTETMRGDTIGVTFTYDDQYLELVEDECSWAKQGVLQDFDRRKNAGVWADSKVTEFSGEICTLAFRVITEKQYFDTKVSCTVVVKNGAAEAGTVQADAKVYSECAHEFGGWVSKDEAGHQHICRLCQTAVLEPHKWKQGETRKDPDRPNVAITVFVCEDCAAKKSQEHGVDQQPTFPDVQKPTQPSQPGNNGSANTTKPSGGSNDEDDHTGHNHGPLIADPEWYGVAAVLGIAVVLILVAARFVKKKR